MYIQAIATKDSSEFEETYYKVKFLSTLSYEKQKMHRKLKD